MQELREFGDLYNPLSPNEAERIRKISVWNQVNRAKLWKRVRSYPITVLSQIKGEAWKGLSGRYHTRWRDLNTGRFVKTEDTSSLRHTTPHSEETKQSIREKRAKQVFDPFTLKVRGLRAGTFQNPNYWN
jgi:hypothetical protein